MKNILKNEHWKCWATFVLSCVYICNQVITVTDLQVLDHLLLKFCKSFESLYGSDRVTPNMHMHCHLVDSIKS